MSDFTFPDDPRMMAAIELVQRTGASNFQIRYDDHEEPTIWAAIATYDEPTRHEVGGAMTPALAIFRLCATLVDGGQCRHCGRPTAFNEADTRLPDLKGLLCVYAYDPELKTYRRSCEGMTPPLE